MIITHCGTEIVKDQPQTNNAKIKKLAETSGIVIMLAHDEMTVVTKKTSTTRLSVNF